MPRFVTQREARNVRLVHLAGAGCMIGVLTGAAGMDAITSLAVATLVYCFVRAFEGDRSW